MLVILNSDVLYTNQFPHKRLHRHWNEFAKGCRAVGAELVIPGTALYEIQLRQRELYEEERQNIENAAALLAKYGVELVAPLRQDLIGEADLVRLFSDAGVRVRVENATLEDFRDAERRAALHLPPSPPRGPRGNKHDKEESDEMRDLVIWAIACRLAAGHGGAILLSRDKVHRAASSRAEAEERRLLCAVDFDEALGMLGAETDAGKIATGLLRAAWIKLREAGLPLREQFQIKTVTDIAFVQGEAGIQNARFAFSCDTNDDKRLRAIAEVSDISEAGFDLRLAESFINEARYARGDVNVHVSHARAEVAPDVEERLNALRELLE